MNNNKESSMKTTTGMQCPTYYSTGKVCTGCEKCAPATLPALLTSIRSTMKVLFGENAAVMLDLAEAQRLAPVQAQLVASDEALRIAVAALNKISTWSFGWDGDCGVTSAADTALAEIDAALAATQPAAVAQPVASDERTMFEHTERESELRRDEEGDYINPFVQSAWEGWQARAALAARKPAECSGCDPAEGFCKVCRALAARKPAAPSEAGDLWWALIDKASKRILGTCGTKDEAARTARLAQLDPDAIEILPLTYAAPSIPAQAGVPDGYVLVPIEPTPEMLDDAGQALSKGGAEGNVLELQGDAHTAWNAMLAAAPAPTEADSTGDHFDLAHQLQCVVEALNSKDRDIRLSGMDAVTILKKTICIIRHTTTEQTKD